VFFASNDAVNTDATFADSHLISETTEQAWPIKSRATLQLSDTSMLFATKKQENQFKFVQYSAAAPNLNYIKELENSKFKGFIASTTTNAFAAHVSTVDQSIILTNIQFAAAPATIVSTLSQNWTSILAVEQVSQTSVYMLVSPTFETNAVELVHLSLETFTVSTLKSFTLDQGAAFPLKQASAKQRLTFKKGADFYFVELSTTTTPLAELKITESQAPTEAKQLANVFISLLGNNLIASDGDVSYKLSTMDEGSSSQQALVFANNLYIVVTKIGSCKIYKTGATPDSFQQLSFNPIDLAPTARMFLATPTILAIQSGDNIFTITEVAAPISLHPERRVTGRLVAAYKNSLLIEQVNAAGAISLVAQENDKPQIMTTVLASNAQSVANVFFNAVTMSESQTTKTAKILFFMRVRTVATNTVATVIYANEIRSYCDGNEKCNAHGRCGADQCFCFSSAQQGYWKGDKCDSCPTSGLVASSNCTVCDVATHAAPGCTPNTCFGKNDTDAAICNGRGRCISTDKCECQDNYIGASCEEFECYGFNKNDARVCSYSGKCVDFNDCQCLPGFSGYNCKEWRQDDYLWILIIFMIFASGFLVVILLLAVGFLYINKQPAMSHHRPVMEDGEDFMVPTAIVSSGGNSASGNVQAQHSGAWVELHEDNDDDDIVGLDEVHSQ